MSFSYYTTIQILAKVLVEVAVPASNIHIVGHVCIICSGRLLFKHQGKHMIN